MEKYSFIYNNETYLILDMNKKKGKDVDELICKGFCMLEIEAESKKDAIDKFRNIVGENSHSLKEYTKDISFSSIIEAFLR